MAAPIETFVQLPDDSGNTGKKVRSQTRVVGSNTVHHHFVVPVRQKAILGVYRAGLAQRTVLAAADNGTTGFYFVAHVPAAVSGKSCRVRRVHITSMHASVLATPTAPRLVLARATFTGTASGAQVTSVKMDTIFGASVLDIRTASTGLTIVLVANAASAGLVGALTAVSAYAPAEIDMIEQEQDEDAWITLAPGECLVCYQDVNGTTSDTRVYEANLIWDDIDTA